MSLHMITHAVMFAVIATLLKKYFQLMYHVEDLQERCLYNEFKCSVHDDSEVKMEDKLQVEHNLQAFFTCHSSRNPSQHVCHLRNMCYEPNQNIFVYFYRESDDNFLFIDKQSLPYLSTPVGFNDHRMSVTYVNEKFASEFKLKWINKTTYIFSRFKSDNLMHVLHDDLIPLFFTIKHFEGLKSNMAATKFDVQLLFLDDWPRGDFMQLYDLFTNSPPIYSVDLLRGRELLCFSSAIVGLLLDTLWYQYGFTEPQGPIVDSRISAVHIQSASQFILQNLNLKMDVKTSDYIVLISRKENRKILNENDLVRTISQEIAMKVFILGSETYAINEMISLVANSTGIIGMHGSLLSLAVFLKPGSILIELFPYAVPAQQYTTYKSLANLEGMGTVYKSWENTDPGATIGHPDYIPEHGGITHLLPEEQQMIINQKTVPVHLCCNDPSWLYHIYQDTKVNVPEIIQIMKLALNQGNNKRSLNITKTPSKVKNIRCRFNKNESKCNIQLQWEKPWNIRFLDFTKLHYEVILEYTGSEDTVLYVVDQDSLTVDIDCEKSYIAWVHAVIDDHVYGEYVSKECHV